MALSSLLLHRPLSSLRRFLEGQTPSEKALAARCSAPSLATRRLFGVRARTFLTSVLPNPNESSQGGDVNAGSIPVARSLSHVQPYSCPLAWLRFRSHDTFFPTTWPPVTSARGFPSFGSNTLTSAGSAARNPQKFDTPLYLNAALRTAFVVSGWRVFAVRELWS